MSLSAYDSEDLDIEIDKQYNTMKTFIHTTLKNNVQEVEDVVKDNIVQVEDGIVQVEDGIVQVEDGIVQVEDGIVQVEDGIVQVEDGIVQVEDGIVQVEDGIVQVEDGIVQVEDGIVQVEDDVIISVMCFSKILDLEFNFVERAMERYNLDIHNVRDFNHQNIVSFLLNDPYCFDPEYVPNILLAKQLLIFHFILHHKLSVMY